MCFRRLCGKLPDTQVIDWLDRQPRTSIWTTSITLLEVRFGLQIMTAGKRRSFLIEAFAAVLGKLGHRVIPFDVAAAQQAGDLMASRQKKGRPVELRDTMIAGIVLAQRATLATRNTAHFADIATSVINPWMV
jgi:predicted nucleic acid-binding protein